MADEGFFAYKPIRVVLTGDKIAGKAFIPAAQRKLADLDKSLTFQNLQQGFAEHVLDDGCTCTVRNTLEERVIFIDHAPTVPVEEELEWLEGGCFCSDFFSECEVLGISDVVVRRTGGIEYMSDMPGRGERETLRCYDVLRCYSDGNEGHISELLINVPSSDCTIYRTGAKAILLHTSLPYSTDDTGVRSCSIAGIYSEGNVYHDDNIPIKTVYTLHAAQRRPVLLPINVRGGKDAYFEYPIILEKEILQDTLPSTVNLEDKFFPSLSANPSEWSIYDGGSLVDTCTPTSGRFYNSTKTGFEILEFSSKTRNGVPLDRGAFRFVGKDGKLRNSCCYFWRTKQYLTLDLVAPDNLYAMAGKKRPSDFSVSGVPGGFTTLIIGCLDRQRLYYSGDFEVSSLGAIEDDIKTSPLYSTKTGLRQNDSYCLKTGEVEDSFEYVTDRNHELIEGMTTYRELIEHLNAGHTNTGMYNVVPKIGYQIGLSIKESYYPPLQYATVSTNIISDERVVLPCDIGEPWYPKDVTVIQETKKTVHEAAAMIPDLCRFYTEDDFLWNHKSNTWEGCPTKNDLGQQLRGPGSHYVLEMNIGGGKASGDVCRWSLKPYFSNFLRNTFMKWREENAEWPGATEYPGEPREEIEILYYGSGSNVNVWKLDHYSPDCRVMSLVHRRRKLDDAPDFPHENLYGDEWSYSYTPFEVSNIFLCEENYITDPEGDTVISDTEPVFKQYAQEWFSVWVVGQLLKEAEEAQG